MASRTRRTAPDRHSRGEVVVLVEVTDEPLVVEQFGECGRALTVIGQDLRDGFVSQLENEEVDRADCDVGGAAVRIEGRHQDLASPIQTAEHRQAGVLTFVVDPRRRQFDDRVGAVGDVLGSVAQELAQRNGGHDRPLFARRARIARGAPEELISRFPVRHCDGLWRRPPAARTGRRLLGGGRSKARCRQGVRTPRGSRCR